MASAARYRFYNESSINLVLLMLLHLAWPDSVIGLSRLKESFEMLVRKVLAPSLDLHLLIFD